MGVQVTVWPRGAWRARAAGPLGVPFGETARRVGRGVFASDIGRLASVSASTRYEDGFGGHDLASWTLAPGRGYAGGMFRPGDHVRITKGGGTVWEGRYAEAEPGEDGTMVMHARGYGYQLYAYDSVYYEPVGGITDPDIFYPTTRLVGGEAGKMYGWEYALSLGLPISQVVGALPAAAFGEAPVAERPVKIGDVLTAHLREASQRWAVWGRSLVIAADDMTPRWRLEAPRGLVGVADSDYRTHVGVWYVHTAPGTDPTDWGVVWAVDHEGVARFEPATEVVDYRGLGLVTEARAQNLAQTLLDQVKGRFVFSGSVTCAPGSGLVSAAGGRADVAFVRAGQALELANLRTAQGNVMPGGGLVMIGKTDWSWDADGQERTTLTPMGSVARSLGEILRGQPADSTSLMAGAA